MCFIYSKFYYNNKRIYSKIRLIYSYKYGVSVNRNINTDKQFSIKSFTNKNPIPIF